MPDEQFLEKLVKEEYQGSVMTKEKGKSVEVTIFSNGRTYKNQFTVGDKAGTKLIDGEFVVNKSKFNKIMFDAVAKVEEKNNETPISDVKFIMGRRELTGLKVIDGKAYANISTVLAEMVTGEHNVRYERHTTKHEYQIKFLNNEGKTTNGKKITQDMLRKMQDGAYYYPLEQLIKDLKFEDRVKTNITENGTLMLLMSKKEIENNFTNAFSFGKGLFDGAMKSIEDTWETIKDRQKLLDGTMFLLDLINPMSDSYKTLMGSLINESVDFATKFAVGNSNQRWEMTGKLLGGAVLEVIFSKGVSATVGALKAFTKSGALKMTLNVADTVVDNVMDVKKGRLVKGLETVAEAIERVGATMSKIKATNIIEKSAEEMNAFWKIEGYTNSPYKASTIVKEFKLAENTNFVRVYDKIDSGIRGGWVMKAEDIAGLTAQQIKDKFALKNLPQYICDVEVDAGVKMHCGVAEEISGWGKGGGIQFDLNADRTVGSFFNERMIQ